MAAIIKWGREKEKKDDDTPYIISTSTHELRKKKK
jgi:hypothetical protein